MKNLSLLLTVLVAGSGALSSDILSFRPNHGEARRMDYERVFKLSLEESTSQFLVEGNEHPIPSTEGLDYHMTETETVAFLDRYTLENGTLLRMERRFEDIGNLIEQSATDAGGETFETNLVGESELEGATVIFSRGAAGDEFQAAFGEASEDLDEDLLAGLQARTDFAGFLSSEKVAQGDAWEVPLPAFIRLTDPSGDLSVLQEEEEPDDVGAEYASLFDENMEGIFQAKWTDTREEDGQSLALIELTAELETLIAQDVATEAAGTPVMEQRSDIYAFELKGVLIWNMTSHRAHSLNLEGDVHLARSSVKEFEMQGSEVVITKIQKFEGNVTYTVTVE
jgi:hypothetical protein